jgi:hypothetical protein
MRSRTAWVALALATVMVGTLHAAREEPSSVAAPMSLRYADGRLSVRLARVPLYQVMATLERELGVVVEGELLDRREVTKQFDDVPLPRALARILGRQNFTLRYDAEGNPVRIDLLGLPAAAPPKQEKPKPLPTLATVIAREPPVVLSPRLRDVLRRPSARLVHVLGTALRHGDPAVRADARRLVLTTFEQRSTIRAALQRSTSGEIATFLRPWPANNVDALLSEIKIRTRDPYLRAIARQAEQTLQRTRAATASGQARQR